MPAFFDRLKLIVLAESLGAVESLVGYPWRMSHARMSAAERVAADITDTTLRFSIGIEDAADLQRDVEHALQAL